MRISVPIDVSTRSLVRVCVLVRAFAILPNALRCPGSLRMDIVIAILNVIAIVVVVVVGLFDYDSDVQSVGPRVQISFDRIRLRPVNGSPAHSC